MRVVLLFVAASLSASCVTKAPVPSALAEGCLLNSDCESPLVCAFRRCHSACETSRDCPAGLHCRPADRPFNVCLLPDEVRCERDTDCVNAMSCGVDGICRSACTSALACLPEQLCVQGVCADGVELINGTLPIVIDAGFGCTRNSECPVGELCARGVCIAECVNSRDCPVGATCVGGRCLGGRCALHSDCPPGQRCSPVGWCAPECVEPRDCPSGLSCVNAVCTTPTPDAGPVADAGAGADGGLDGGAVVTDAGAPDAGPRCVLNGECGAGRWCDEGTCAPSCTTSPCTGGRVCDARVGTCVRSCAQGCGLASVCDTSPDAGVDGGIGACLRTCDGSFRCGFGQVCRAGLCAPECVSASDCRNAHATCSLGQCVFDGTCDDDRDCAATDLCRMGRCSPRPTAMVDAGGGQPPSYACAEPCDCRLGEWCSRGRCLPDAVPTWYFARDAGGDGRSTSTPAGTPFDALADAGIGEVLALREGDTWPRTGSVDLKSRVSLVGGYKVCTPQRWVRGDSLTTTLALTSGSVRANAVTDASLRSVTLVVQGPSLEAALVTGASTNGLWLEHVRGRTLSPGAANPGPGVLVSCTACPDLRVSDLTYLTSEAPGSTTGLLRLTGGSGTFSRLVLEAQPPIPANSSLGIGVDGPTGPMRFEDVTLGEPGGRFQPVGISISNCQSGAVTLERATVAWPTAATTSVNGVVVLECDVALRDVRLEGGSGPFPPSVTGMSLTRTGGTLERVTVRPPVTSTAFTGIDVSAARPLTLRDTRVDASIVGPCAGIVVDFVAQGPVLLERVSSFVSGTANPNVALVLRNVPPQVGVRVVDSDLEATSSGFFCSRRAIAVQLVGAAATIERSRLRAWSSASPVAADVGATATLGLFASHLWTGANVSFSGCSTNEKAAALVLAGAARIGSSTLDGDGSEFQQEPSSAIACDATSTSLDVSSSILGGGRAQGPWLLNGPCPTTSWRNTWFWFDRLSSGVRPTDAVLQIVQADAGVFDLNGNMLAPNESCFEPGLPDAGPAYRLRAGARCVDRGAISTRADGTPVLLDIDGRPRDGGAGPDIGCSER
ncbi:MAG: hypothetical protein Q8L14_34375 [Myxococcales bacterium]|nr:hypothetical protein [Myxococcales bacterium]